MQHLAKQLILQPLVRLPIYYKFWRTRIKINHLHKLAKRCKGSVRIYYY